MLTSTTNINFYDMIDTIQGGITGTYKWLREMGLSTEDCMRAITIATNNAMLDEYCTDIIERNKQNANKEKAD